MARDIHLDDPAQMHKGLLRRPFSDRSCPKPPSSVCSQRFAIVQNGKPRAIEDLKESGVSLSQFGLH